MRCDVKRFYRLPPAESEKFSFGRRGAEDDDVKMCCRDVEGRDGDGVRGCLDKAGEAGGRTIEKNSF